MFGESCERKKKAVVTKALLESIACRDQRSVAKLMGKLEWDDLFDCKAEQSRTNGRGSDHAI